MRLFSLSAGAVFLMVSWAGVRPQEREAATFPTNTEITLVLTQAERAVIQYEPLLDMEEHNLGKKGTEAIAKDREVLSALKMAIAGFKKQPQQFNSALGFAFFEWLDDADRNALLCASTALTDANTAIVAGDRSGAEANLTLSQGCQAVSTLFYTVSENAGALYTRYVQSEAELAERGAEIAKQCAAALKQHAAPKN